MAEERKTRTLSVRVSEETKFKFVEMCKSRGLGSSDMFRLLVDTESQNEIIDRQRSIKCMYICDSEACARCTKTSCRHTTDLHHAKNFIRLNTGIDCEGTERYMYIERRNEL